MLAQQNVFECEGQSITHDQLGPLNDCVYTMGFPGDKTAPRQTPNDIVRDDGLEIPVSVAQSGKKLLGNFNEAALGGLSFWTQPCSVRGHPCTMALCHSLAANTMPLEYGLIF